MLCVLCRAHCCRELVVQQHADVKSALLAFARARPDTVFMLQPQDLAAMAQVRGGGLRGLGRQGGGMQEGLGEVGVQASECPSINVASPLLTCRT